MKAHGTHLYPVYHLYLVVRVFGELQQMTTDRPDGPIQEVPALEASARQFEMGVGFLGSHHHSPRLFVDERDEWLVGAYASS